MAAVEAIWSLGPNAQPVPHATWTKVQWSPIVTNTYPASALTLDPNTTDWIFNQTDLHQLVVQVAWTPHTSMRRTKLRIAGADLAVAETELGWTAKMAASNVPVNQQVTMQNGNVTVPYVLDVRVYQDSGVTQHLATDGFQAPSFMMCKLGEIVL